MNTKVRKPYRPAIACRVDQETYDFYYELADRRIESISEQVLKALKEYKEKTELIKANLENPNA